MEMGENGDEMNVFISMLITMTMTTGGGSGEGEMRGSRGGQDRFSLGLAAP